MLASFLATLADFHRRMLTVYLVVLGPRLSYWLTAVLARWLYAIVPVLRERSEAHCGAALAGRVPRDQVARIAAASFVHRIHSLVDLLLADRLLHRGTFHRYGGRIIDAVRERLLDAQRRRQPLILLSSYYGPFDLLPTMLSFNGVQALAVYKPHANPHFDAVRQRVRARGGCEFVTVEQAVSRVPAVLESGGTVALIADHHAEGRGIEATFLGLPTRALKTVGLLAMQYRAVIVVSGIRRVGQQFRFELVLGDLVRPQEWEAQPDPVRYITERYLRALERIIYDDPTQYVWASDRWGEQTAAQLTRA